jgi:hypothetical protein
MPHPIRVGVQVIDAAWNGSLDEAQASDSSKRIASPLSSSLRRTQRPAYPGFGADAASADQIV